MDISIKSFMENKLRGIDHYNNKFKNKKKVKRNFFREYVGNTMSSSSSRPGSEKISNTYPDKLYNKEVSHHQIVDHTIYNGDRLYRDTCIQSIVSYNSSKVKTEKILADKCCNVALKVDIAIDGSKISLGNKQSLLDHTGVKIYFGSDYVADYNINFDDKRTITYQEFLNVMDKIIKIIEHNKNSDILIACDAGVNRSPAVVIGYMIYTGMRYYDALNVIEESKIKTNPNWNNLTNFTIRHILRLYDNNMK